MHRRKTFLVYVENYDWRTSPRHKEFFSKGQAKKYMKRKKGNFDLDVHYRLYRKPFTSWYQSSTCAQYEWRI